MAPRPAAAASSASTSAGGGRRPPSTMVVFFEGGGGGEGARLCVCATGQAGRRAQLCVCACGGACGLGLVKRVNEGRRAKKRSLAHSLPLIFQFLSPRRSRPHTRHTTPDRLPGRTEGPFAALLFQAAHPLRTSSRPGALHNHTKKSPLADLKKKMSRLLAASILLLAAAPSALASIHAYDQEYFYSVGDAYIFRGGREGLYASTKEVRETGRKKASGGNGG